MNSNSNDHMKAYFLCFRLEFRPQWNLLMSIKEIFERHHDLLVVDHRTTTNTDDRKCKNEVYVRVCNTNQNKTGQIVNEIVETLRKTINQNDAIVEVKEWHPPAVNQDATISSTTTSKKQQQQQEQHPRSLLPDFSTIVGSRRQRRQRVHSTPIGVGNGLFGIDEKSAHSQKKEWGTPAELVVNGRVYKLRIDHDSVAKLRRGETSHDYHGFPMRSFQITAQHAENDDNDHGLHGLIRK